MVLTHALMDGLFERNNKTTVPSVEEYVKNIHNTIDIAKKNLMKAQLQMKKQADVGRRDHPFKGNDLVYVTASHIKPQSRVNKLNPLDHLKS